MSDNITRAQEIYDILFNTYPNASVELNFNSTYELLVAVILSAQCTDKRVNLVTNELFKAANTPQSMLSLGEDKLKQYIHSCGFYNQKAKSIISASLDILTKHSGQVPDNFDDLIKLKGVGRKTANVVLSNAFNVPAIAVDTHVFRVSRRLGLSDGKTPDAVENDLNNLFADGQKSLVHHLLIFHGRYCCHSQKPNCGDCPLTQYCTFIC